MTNISLDYPEEEEEEDAKCKPSSLHSVNGEMAEVSAAAMAMAVAMAVAAAVASAVPSTDANANANANASVTNTTNTTNSTTKREEHHPSITDDSASSPYSPSRIKPKPRKRKVGIHPVVIDPELQRGMQEFLGDGPMRFGPAVVPPSIQIRQQLVEGPGTQLATYVRLKTRSEVKRKHRGVTDFQILRIVQFCQQHYRMEDSDGAAYDLLKKCRLYYFYMTASDRQPYIQEQRLVVPIPQLRLKDVSPRNQSRVVYFRPSRYWPKKQASHKVDVLDTLIYILDNWTQQDAALSGTNSFIESPVKYALLVHLQDFTMDHFAKDYWSKLMALLQGRVFPVHVDVVLWVDAPPAFEKVWHATQSMMLSKTFRSNNHLLASSQLGTYLQPSFQDLLPVDELLGVLERNRTEPSSSLGTSLGDMAKDYVQFRKYIETIQGKTTMAVQRSSKRSGRARRRFSLPLKLRRRKSRKPKEGDVDVDVDIQEGSQSQSHSHSHTNEGSDEDEENHEKSRSTSVGHRRKKEQTREQHETAQDVDNDEESISESNPPSPSLPSAMKEVEAVGRSSQPMTAPHGLTEQKSMRRNSQPMAYRRGAGIIGGRPISHTTPRRSSLSVLEELQEQELSKELSIEDIIEEEVITPPRRRRRRVSLKALLSPLKFRRRRRHPKKSDAASVVSSTSNDLEKSIHAAELFAGRPSPRRHSSKADFFSRQSNQMLLDESAEFGSNNNSNSNSVGDSGFDSMNNGSFDWSTILSEVNKNNGTPLKSPQKIRRGRRQSASEMALGPLPFLPLTSPKSSPMPSPEGSKKPQDLAYFLNQVERQKEKTRRLQQQRIGSSSVS